MTSGLYFTRSRSSSQLDCQGSGAFQGPRFQKLIGQRLLECVIDGPRIGKNLTESVGPAGTRSTRALTSSGSTEAKNDCRHSVRPVCEWSRDAPHEFFHAIDGFEQCAEILIRTA